MESGNLRIKTCRYAGVYVMRVLKQRGIPLPHVEGVNHMTKCMA